MPPSSLSSMPWGLNAVSKLANSIDHVPALLVTGSGDLAH